MKVSASAPGKVILFGEHFVVYGGRAVATAVKYRATVTAVESDSRHSAMSGSFGDIRYPGYELPREALPFARIADIIRERYGSDEGVTLSIQSEIPQGAGLGSSSACYVAAAAATSRMYSEASGHKPMDAYEIRDIALEAERTIFSRASGIDSTISALGGTIAYSSEEGVQSVPVSPEVMMLIVDSGQRHTTSDVVERVYRYRESNPRRFRDIMISQDAIVREATAALRAADLEALGLCMKRNQRNLDAIGVSTDLLRQMIKTADSVTYGSKLTGAGGGGCIIAISAESTAESWPGPQSAIPTALGCPGIMYC